ncbi:MAG: c-type cytochrome [Candidatus Sulfotelmatobacter sp.]
MRPKPVLSLLLFSLVCLAQNQNGSTDPERSPRMPIEGAKIFQHYCAACHGADGRGHGPASVALKHSPPDLTLISQRNGGKFPYQQVKDIIEGKQAALPAHGNREMPIWGPIFHQVDADQDWGEVRLDAIAKHLESMQQK